MGRKDNERRNFCPFRTLAHPEIKILVAKVRALLGMMIIIKWRTDVLQKVNG